ncbi:uncharacterized protein LOC127286680 isoform X2 [Leptopilina boulardi]|uniref:uncharacterized protein LOC127286680 isoform X2 n=1 Tax=Leptopilina boulardi TaxID=63433 RepID=UPI0021F55CBA|nr:uncharacterized protein LOC127286680 isoform X2 [Leptopilina boulardi]
MEKAVKYRNKECVGVCEASTSTKQFSNEMNKFQQLKNSSPYCLISHTYQLELSTLCLLKKSSFKNSKDSIIFQNSVSGQFDNIILCFREEAICIKIQHVDTYYIKASLDFDSFFSNRNGNFTLRNYLNEFATFLFHSNFKLNLPKYLIIYTNSALILTMDKKLKQIETTNCDLQFTNINSNIHNVLVDLFKSNGEFYQFANDEKTRNQLFKLVKFKDNIIREIIRKGFSVEEIKQKFFDRLIFAVNQPNLEELIDNVRREIRKKK